MDTSFAITSSAFTTTAIRHAVTAHDVANINTDGFSESSVVQSDLSTGGVEVAAIRKNQNINPHGYSNTDFVTEAGEMVSNKNVYGANAKVFKVQDKMVGELLDIFG